MMSDRPSENHLKECGKGEDKEKPVKSRSCQVCQSLDAMMRIILELFGVPLSTWQRSILAISLKGFFEKDRFSISTIQIFSESTPDLGT